MNYWLYLNIRTSKFADSGNKFLFVTRQETAINNRFGMLRYYILFVARIKHCWVSRILRRGANHSRH